MLSLSQRTSATLGLRAAVFVRGHVRFAVRARPQLYNDRPKAVPHGRAAVAGEWRGSEVESKQLMDSTTTRLTDWTH